MSSLSRLFWRMADPFLLRLRSRLEHLEAIAPSPRYESQARAIGSIAPTARIMRTAYLQSSASKERLVIGEYSHIAGEISVLTPSASFQMGAYCFLGEGSRIWAADSVTIGDYVLIAHDVDILDNDSHSLDHRNRRKDAVDMFRLEGSTDFGPIASTPVVIEDDAWIGAKSIVLKGVRIGRGAVVAAGSVVTADVPPFTLVAGNPARAIRDLPNVDNIAAPTP